MRGALIRVKRKLSNHGFLSTCKSIWHEVFLLKFLMSEPIMNALHQYYSPKTVTEMANCILDPEWVGCDTARIPDKIWIDGDAPLESAQTYEIPGPRLYQYDECYLCLPSGLGMTKQGEVIPDTIASTLAWSRNRYRTFIPKMVYDHGMVVSHRLLSGPPEIDAFDLGTVLPVLPYWRNYYHWTAECLPKLLWLEREEVEREAPTILIPSQPTDWMVESLELLGVTEYAELRDGVYASERLLLPSYPEPSPQGCEWFRQRAHSSLDLSKTPDNRVYISRERANRRRVENQGEIMDLLSEFGFKSYVLESMSVREQAELFSNAAIVVGPHGAGFTNLMYARDTSVIELFGSRKKLTFYRLAKLQRFDYQAVTGQDNPPDIHIDVEDLRKALERAIA